MANEEIRVILIRKVINGWVVTVVEKDYVYKDADELIDGLATLLHKHIDKSEN